jgi:hypothetical protein
MYVQYQVPLAKQGDQRTPVIMIHGCLPERQVL